MSPTATNAPPIAVDVAVILTAIVRPEPDVGGYSASIPALPGCHTQGETLDEVRANLREAAEGWLAVAHDDGLARDASGAVP
jgi:predicted RNase H-like HicB family nuclease